VVELPRIKVCGITTVDDARAAVEAGCDALGFVEHTQSPRCVDVERARAIVAELDVLAVVVMVDRAPEFALHWLEQSGARAVQLCGTENPWNWRGFPHLLLRRIAVAETAERELDAWREVANGFVLDHPSAPGGTGLGVDLAHAARLAALAPCLLAGGLGADNVAERIAAVQPYGVDASSRLELAPGRKDHERVAAFVQRAHTALLELRR
jgi:phosphoribosylanthranilate isomerase